jgi:hypothetical protein
LGQADDRAKLPIEAKESFRWLKGFRHATALAQACPDTHVVSVADREADIYDIFTEHRDQPTNADFVIRAKAERSLTEPDPETGPWAYHKMKDRVAESPVRAVRQVDLPKTPKREARRATLELRALTVTLKPPHTRGAMKPVTLNVVWVTERDGPGDGTDVSWLLITSLPVETIADVELVVDCYVARWGIEVYFRIFKTGCRVEQIQLETVARLKTCLAFYEVIAWRVMYTTYLNRASPELPCDVVFDSSEWKSVWHVTQKTAPPAEPPSLGEFMKVLTGLGGYNNRRKENPAGPQTVWVGIRRMTDFAIAWDAFGPEQQTCG